MIMNAFCRIGKMEVTDVYILKKKTPIHVFTVIHSFSESLIHSLISCVSGI